MRVTAHLALPLLLTVSCSSTPPPRGSVVMTVNASEAHVRAAGLSAGEKIVCRRKHCEPDPSKGKGLEDCAMRVVGRATITRELGNDYSIAGITKGECAEGDLVERAP